eukprot:TRINITY_DN10047_c1_g2_i1.p1 TRINITY_DN10047_c1_g2~~TRINITY_DN10047_c1_g2_i1.p1  ORF type:complete len:563 (-),score=135.47 TRINITY_DN10047_c1_g2_i1:89-1777(-)
MVRIRQMARRVVEEPPILPRTVEDVDKKPGLFIYSEVKSHPKDYAGLASQYQYPHSFRTITTKLNDPTATHDEKMIFFVKSMRHAIKRYETCNYDDGNLVLLITSFTNGLDEYIRIAKEVGKPVHSDIIEAVVARMGDDDFNDPFWKNMCDSGQLFALHDAVEELNVPLIKKLIEESCPMYRSMIDGRKELREKATKSKGSKRSAPVFAYDTKKAGALTPLHKLMKLPEEAKMNFWKLFIDDGKMHLGEFISLRPYGRHESLLQASVCSTTIPFLDFMMRNGEFDMYPVFETLNATFKVGVENCKRFEYIFDSYGKSIGDYCNQCIMSHEESLSDCNTLCDMQKLFVELRKRDIARLLFTVTNSDFNKQELHFVEEIVDDTMMKWISIQEYVEPKSLRTLRDSLEVANEGRNPTPYVPKYDFTDTNNPELAKIRFRSFVMAHQEDAEEWDTFNNADLNELCDTANEVPGFRSFTIGNYPKWEEIASCRCPADGECSYYCPCKQKKRSCGSWCTCPCKKPEEVKKVQKSLRSTFVSKPACRYGSDCYRRNPAHFAEFWHPGDL